MLMGKLRSARSPLMVSVWSLQVLAEMIPWCVWSYFQTLSLSLRSRSRAVELEPHTSCLDAGKFSLAKCTKDIVLKKPLSIVL